MDSFPTYMSACSAHRSQKVIRSPRIGVIHCCATRPLEMQPVFLTTEALLQTPLPIYKIKYLTDIVSLLPFLYTILHIFINL